MPRIQPFDEHLQEYEEWFERHRFVYLSEIEAIRHFIPRGKNGIEIGIGTGRFALPLGIKEGIEPSRTMQEFAARLGLKIYGGVAEDLPLADQSFDFALMVTTVCFVDDILLSFREVHRVTRSDGLFIIGIVDKDSHLGRVYEQIKAHNVFYRFATFYSVREVIDNLKETGFGKIEIVQTIFGNIESIHQIQSFKQGYGEGGFAAIKASKLV